MSTQPHDPTRGAGFAAGRTAAAAARLVADVARASRDSWADAPGVVAQANALADRLEVLAEADADVFAAALVALATPSAELEPHMQRAAALPLEIAEAASSVAAVAALVAERCDGLVRADAAGAAALAAGAAAAAAHLVGANLTVTPDDPRLKQALRAADDARYSASRTLDSDA
jgi:formiminotetrahydrofolate cyclodeaminase